MIGLVCSYSCRFERMLVIVLKQARCIQPYGKINRMFYGLPIEGRECLKYLQWLMCDYGSNMAEVYAKKQTTQYRKTKCRQECMRNYNYC